MKKLIIFIFLTFNLYASLTTYNYNDRDLEVLKSFDVDKNFIHDKNFLDMKRSVIAGYQKDRLFQKFDEGYLFVPILKDMISEAGIPPEFLYLAMVESEFNVRAYSIKSAAGLWQFMPATARLFGLKINTYVDERRDPIKSTWAAINYLQDLYGRYGKWYLAAIAYNCGPGRLNSAIKRAGSDDLSILLDTNKRYIPRESRNYIRKILSVSMAFNSVDLMVGSDFGYFLNRGAGYPVSTIKVKGGTHLSSVAKSMNMSIDDLKKYNRHLRYDFIQPRVEEYDIYVPYEKLAFFKENYTHTQNSLENVFEVHIVRSGDTLSGIGNRYGVSWRLIKDTNNLKSNFLRLNQKLIIPITKTLTTAKQSGTKYSSYVIKSGDTIYSIARKFRSSVEKIKKYNNLDSNIIQPGDKIVIPN